ncbi:hypothetical protein E4U49_001408 [Claviceps purpurea]|nr:hypothetical protein E4U49_001408 [Claviceps purpurea]
MSMGIASITNHPHESTPIPASFHAAAFMCQGHILRMPVSPIGSTHPSVCPGGDSKIRASIFSSSASTHEDCLVHSTESSAYSIDLAPRAVLHPPVCSLRVTMRWLKKHSKHDICQPHWTFKLAKACTRQSEHCTLRRRVT